jgi:hypothetical protein
MAALGAFRNRFRVFARQSAQKTPQDNFAKKNGEALLQCRNVCGI